MTRLLRGLALASLLLCATGLLVPSPASACSICRCGDPTFNSLGTGVFASGAFRFALDYERFEKEQGIFEGDPHHGSEEEPALARASLKHGAVSGSESVVENRVTASLTYTMADRVLFAARIPWSSRRLTEHIDEEGGESDSTRDLADPEVYALVRLWSSELAPGLGRRAWISLLGGVKTDWGKNDLEAGGERLDEHMQAGTGSTDWFGGLSGVYLFDKTSSLFGSFQLRRTETNDFDYRYGNVTLANLGYERKLGPVVDAALELNYRDAGEDRIDAEGTRDPNTGGKILYLTPRVFFDLGHKLVGRLSVQVPVADDLNGDQEEKAVANVGLTYLF